jgi:hypothetical protein
MYGAADTVMNCRIIGNSGGGIRANVAFISNNVIESNTAAEAAGVRLEAGVVQHNTIRNNSSIINTQEPMDCSVYIGRSSGTRFVSNTVLNNGCQYWLNFGGAQYDGNLDATGNFWGQGLTEAQVRAKVYDYFKDPSRGIVNLAPLLSAAP